MDPDGHAALEGRDAVVHLAAVLRSTDDVEIRQANLEATRRLAEDGPRRRRRPVRLHQHQPGPSGGLGRLASEDDEPAPPAALGRLSRQQACRGRARAARPPPRPRVWARGSSAWRSSTGRATRIWLESLRGGGTRARASAAAADPPRRRGLGGRPRPPRLESTGDLQRQRPTSHRSPPSSCTPQRRTVARQPRRRRTDLWHGVVDTTRIRQELRFRPWYPSVGGPATPEPC